MNYFNEVQIQRIIENLPTEVKGKFDKVTLREITTNQKGTIAQDIIINAFENYNIIFDKIEYDIAKFHISFPSLDTYNQPFVEQFTAVLKEVKEELMNTLGYRGAVRMEVISKGEEPDEIPPLYFGELDEKALYKMIINVYIDSPL